MYKSTTDIVDSTYISEIDGYLQCRARSQKEAGNPFIRLIINDMPVFEGLSPSGMYSYIWSPLFRVRKNDIIKYTITTESSDGFKDLYIFRHK